MSTVYCSGSSGRKAGEAPLLSTISGSIVFCTRYGPRIRYSMLNCVVQPVLAVLIVDGGPSGHLNTHAEQPFIAGLHPPPSSPTP